MNLPMVTASPVTVVSVSPELISSTLPSSKAVIISQSAPIGVSTTTQPAVTIIKTETCQKPSLTALDVLNETIVKSFDPSNVNEKLQNTVKTIAIPSEFPLNLIKNANSTKGPISIRRNETASPNIELKSEEGEGEAIAGNSNSF